VLTTSRLRKKNQPGVSYSKSILTFTTFPTAVVEQNKQGIVSPIALLRGSTRDRNVATYFTGFLS